MVEFGQAGTDPHSDFNLERFAIFYWTTAALDHTPQAQSKLCHLRFSPDHLARYIGSERVGSSLMHRKRRRFLVHHFERLRSSARRRANESELEVHPDPTDQSHPAHHLDPLLVPRPAVWQKRSSYTYSKQSRPRARWDSVVCPHADQRGDHLCARMEPHSRKDARRGSVDYAAVFFWIGIGLRSRQEQAERHFIDRG